jgi:hypothetical protein
VIRDPARLSAVMQLVDDSVSKLMRLRVALEEVEWAQQNAPELHEEARGLGVVLTAARRLHDVR